LPSETIGISLGIRTRGDSSRPARHPHPHYLVITLEKTMNDTQVTKDKLVSDFKAVVADTEELLKLTAGQAGDKVADVRVRLNDKLTAAKYKLQDLEAAVVEKTKAAARATDDYVHDNPWKSVGVAAGVGFLLGLLVNRR